MKSTAFILLIVALLLVSCGGPGETDTEVLPTVPVKTETAQRQTIQQTREFTGGLVGDQQADIYIRLSEAITDLPFEEGDYVTAGQVIVKLDKRGASSNYYQAEASYENAQKTYNKMKELFAEGAVSETQYDDAAAAYRVAEANFTAAREMVELTAPISGQLVDLNVAEGDVPQLGTLAARIARSDTLRLTFGVPAALIDQFDRGLEGQLTVSAIPATFTCEVTDIARAADPATRTFQVEVTVPNREQRLQPGMFAKVQFVINRKEGVIAVDRNALLSTEGIYELFVVEQDTAHSRSVSIGIVNDEHTEIVSGLQEGEEVVVLGQNFLSDGYPIVRSKGNVNDSF
jgi:RND family efflux transporter MFP subunit